MLIYCYNYQALKNAGLAHLVERHLAKVEVASSSLVTRSNKRGIPMCLFSIYCGMWKLAP